MPSPILSLARTLAPPLTLVDVGVRWGFERRWRRLGGVARLVGFDADPAAVAPIASAEVVGAALGEREQEAVPHSTAKPQFASLCEQARRHGQGHRAAVAVNQAMSFGSIGTYEAMRRVRAARGAG